jgi:dihydrofolate reductase
MLADEDLHRHAVENFVQADALLFGRVTYEMMEAAWRLPARKGVRPDWMEPWVEPFARTIDAAKKYVVSSTLDRVDWNAELVRGDLGKAVQQLKRESGKGLFVGGVKLPLRNQIRLNLPAGRITDLQTELLDQRRQALYKGSSFKTS